MSKLAERHEVRVRGRDHTIVFIADSDDGRLVIRQEPDGKKAKDVCAITLSDPEELRGFFKGLRRVLSSLGYSTESAEAPPRAAPAASRLPEGGRAGRASGQTAGGRRQEVEERDAIIAQARRKDAQAFTPWTPQEEEEIRARHARGEDIQSIARVHKRSPRAIELRLQRLGALPG
jgi:hypothetical protein